MGNTTKLKGEIAWHWQLQDMSTPTWIAGDVVSAFHHPNGKMLIHYKWRDKYGEEDGSVKLQNVPGSTRFEGNGTARQSEWRYQISAVRCELVRVDEKHWTLEGTFWRAETKQTDQWKANLTVVDVFPYDPEMEN